MSDDAIKVQKLRAARVFIQRNGDDDVILCMSGSDGDQNYIMKREDFVRLTQSLNQDAMRLSTMQKGDKPS